MQVVQRKVATQSGRNVTVTFYAYGPSRKRAVSNIVNRVETRGQLPILIYKLHGTTEVCGVIPGVSKRFYKTARAAFVSLSTRYWGLGA